MRTKKVKSDNEAAPAMMHTLRVQDWYQKVFGQKMNNMECSQCRV